MSLRILSFTTLFLALMLQGCNKPEDEKRLGRYGRMSDNTPEYAAMMFFDKLYQEKKLDGALQYSTERLANTLRSYHTSRNVQRHVLNLPYDTVVVEPQTGDTVGRNEYAQTATVTLFFTGTYNGDKVDDMRIVDMVKEGRDWKVSKIHADKFL